MKILFENKNLIFAIKPRGVASQSSNGENMISLLSEHTGGEIYPVHRLDTATGGVMVYAKSKKHAASLSEAFAKNEIDKKYLAIVRGQIEPEGIMEDFLWHDKIKNKSFVVKNERKGAKKAKLEYMQKRQQKQKRRRSIAKKSKLETELADIEDQISKFKQSGISDIIKDEERG